MGTLKLNLARFAEYYLIVMIFLAGYTPPFHIIIPAIILIAILALQAIFKNRVSGIIISSIFLMVNLYMVLAMISELSHFNTFNASAQKLLFGGSIIFIVNFIIGGLMVGKYLSATNQNTQLEAAH
jgi:hypothetical protein